MCESSRVWEHVCTCACVRVTGGGACACVCESGGGGSMYVCEDG